MSLLTVIMPARNAEKTIGTAVTSTLRSLSTEGKLLVLDDSSDDATPEVLRKLARADSRVSLLTSHENLGVARSLNALIDATDTPLIARMDADDICLPWRFRSQIPALNRRNLDAVFSPIIMFGHRPYLVQPQAPFSTGPATAPFELLLVNTLSHPTVLGRRSAFVDAGRYRQVPAEDWDLWIRMALRGLRLARVALPSLLYRRHAQQVSESEDWQSAQTVEVETTKTHDELCQRLLGSTAGGAYAALSGSSAHANEVEAAQRLIRAVRMAAHSLPSPDRLSIRRTLWIAIHRLNGIYGPRP